jgi:hypothetical protein
MKRLAIFLTVVFLIFGCKGKSLIPKNSALIKEELKTGDIIFQTLPGELSQVISDVTESSLSHCGMIIREDSGELNVIEAIGPVRIIPIDDFIKNGINERYAVIRLKRRRFKDIDTVAAEAKKYLGRPYDLLYKLDDEYIYCSELVYKAFYNAAKIKIAEPVKLKDLNYKNSVGFIRAVTGGDLPLEREMIVPIDIFNNSDLFEKIFSNYD